MRVTAQQLEACIRAATLPLRIIKATGEARYCLGLAYPANRLDAHGDGMTAEQLERTAWGYLAKQEIGLFHQDGTTGHARPVESYIWRGPDWTVTDVAGGQQTIRAGDWMLGAIWDPEPWRLVKAGKINGWSMDGHGRRRKVPRGTLETVRKSTTDGDRLKRALMDLSREHRR